MGDRIEEVLAMTKPDDRKVPDRRESHRGPGVSNGLRSTDPEIRGATNYLEQAEAAARTPLPEMEIPDFPRPASIDGTAPSTFKVEIEMDEHARQRFMQAMVLRRSAGADHGPLWNLLCAVADAFAEGKNHEKGSTQVRRTAAPAGF